MGALEMIRAVCSEMDTCCVKCPFVNDNMLTPEEKEQIAGDDFAPKFDDCYFELPPDAWDTDRIFVTADSAYKAMIGTTVKKQKESAKEAIKNEKSVADGNNSQD